MNTPLYLTLLICVLMCYAENAVDETSVKSISKSPFSNLNETTGDSVEKSKAQSSLPGPHIRDNNNKGKTGADFVFIVDSKLYEHLLKTQSGNNDPIKHFVTEVSQQRSQVKTLQKNDILSLKQLVNEFPNHVIEIQMEMKDLSPLIPLSNVRSIPSQLKKPQLKLDTGSSLPTVSRAYQPMTDLYERPVYMKDLLEVMQAFESKLTSTSQQPYAWSQNKGGRLSKNDIWSLFGRNNMNQTPDESTSQSPQIQENQFKSNQGNIKLMNNKNPSQIKDINDVLALMKKGIKVQFDITKPTDRNLDWIQIKVPSKNNGDGDSPM